MTDYALKNMAFDIVMFLILYIIAIVAASILFAFSSSSATDFLWRNSNAESLSKVSTYYQELHKQQVTRIKTFIEPILTVFLTVIVGFIIMAIIIPMFGMYESIQTY